MRGVLTQLVVDNLHRMILCRRISQKDVAARAGISDSTLSRILNYRMQPTFDHVERLAEALKVKPYSITSPFRGHVGKKLTCQKDGVTV